MRCLPLRESASSKGMVAGCCSEDFGLMLLRGCRPLGLSPVSSAMVVIRENMAPA